MASTTNSMSDGPVVPGSHVTDDTACVPDEARLDRARATLVHTHGSTGNDWLHELTRRNLRRVDARRVLAAEVEEREQLGGYHPRLRDRARRIY